VNRRTAPVGEGAKKPTAKAASSGKSSASDQAKTIKQLRTRLAELKAENSDLKADLDQTTSVLSKKKASLKHKKKMIDAFGEFEKRAREAFGEQMRLVEMLVEQRGKLADAYMLMRRNYDTLVANVAADKRHTRPEPRSPIPDSVNLVLTQARVPVELVVTVPRKDPRSPPKLERRTIDYPGG